MTSVLPAATTAPVFARRPASFDGFVGHSRVTAIANGNTDGISTDVLIRVLAATGHRAEVRVRKAA